MSGISTDRTERSWAEIVRRLSARETGLSVDKSKSAALNQSLEIRSVRIVATQDSSPPLPLLSWRIVFIDCEFSSRLLPADECIFHQTTFRQPVEFYRCRFDTAVSMDNVRFCQTARFEQCEFRHDLILDIVDDAEFMGIEFIDCQLNCFSLTVSSPASDAPKQSDPRRPEFVRVERSTIKGDLLIDVPPRFRSLSLKSCLFEATSRATVEFSHSPDDPRCSVSLNRSYIVGAVVVEHPDSARPNMVLDLAQATITGNVDLDRASLAELDLNGATLHGGELKLPLVEYFKIPTRGERIRKTSTLDYDRSGPLRLETAESIETAKSIGKESKRLEQLVDQYTELRDSYARLGNRSLEYDICAYKVRAIEAQLQRQRLADAAGKCFGTEGFRFIAAALAAASVLASVVPSLSLLIFLLIVMAAPAALWVWCRYTNHKTLWLQCLFQSTVLRWCFHYGIRLRYSIRTAALAILWFALLFSLSSVCQPNVGAVTKPAVTNPAVTKSEDSVEVFDIADQPWPPATNRKNPGLSEIPQLLWKVAPDSIYFSTVTFTTLGYGDFQPQGRMRLVAASEAVLGLLMAAMITVIFARRYLRL